jgi:hypothetical protein
MVLSCLSSLGLKPRAVGAPEILPELLQEILPESRSPGNVQMSERLELLIVERYVNRIFHGVWIFQ